MAPETKSEAAIFQPSESVPQDRSSKWHVLHLVNWWLMSLHLSSLAVRQGMPLKKVKFFFEMSFSHDYHRTAMAPIRTSQTDKWIQWSVIAPWIVFLWFQISRNQGMTLNAIFVNQEQKWEFWLMICIEKFKPWFKSRIFGWFNINNPEVGPNSILSTLHLYNAI